MPRPLAILPLVAVSLCASNIAASAETITVCGSGCQYTSINAAIEDARDGDVIQLAGETYLEGDAIDTIGKKITIRGVEDQDGDGRPETILDGANQHLVVSCTSGETEETTISDVVIRRGVGRLIVDEDEEFSYTLGGGIFMDNAAPSFVRCWFENNTADYGGGMYASFGNGIDVDTCTFIGNSATWGGGALHCRLCTVDLTGCRIEGNSALYAAGIDSTLNTMSLNECVISENNADAGGSAIYASGSGESASIELLIDRCVIESNHVGAADEEGSGGSALTFGYIRGIIIGTTIANNDTESAQEAVRAHHSNLVIEGCTVTGNTSVGNVGGIGFSVYEPSDDVSTVIITSRVCGNSGLQVGDGVLVGPDNCIAATCGDETDTDLDGMPDFCDAFPEDPDESHDSDNDGVGDQADICPGEDDQLDTDLDGIPDGCDICPQQHDSIDADKDGVPDACDAFPDDPSETSDSDGDGIGDNADEEISIPVGQSIMEAIEAADEGSIIQLGSGTYREVDTLILGDKNITIRGAMSPNGEPLSILDGQRQRTIIMINGDTEAEIVLENLVIEQGAGGLSGAECPMAGGIAVMNNVSATIRHCIIRENEGYMGGGLSICRASVTVEDSIFQDNAATLGSGADLIFGASLRIVRCQFIENGQEMGSGVAGTPLQGGAIRSFGGRIDAEDCVFDGNWADSGGALYMCLGSVGSVNECMFIDNAADDGAGAYFLNSTADLADCQFSVNQARYGGGVMAIESTLDLLECDFTENSALELGGGLLAYRQSLVTGRSIRWFRNTAGPLEEGGNAIYSEESEVFVEHVRLCGNGTVQVTGDMIDLVDACLAADCTSEPDGDGDGWPDACDAFPEDEMEHGDQDGDGIGDSIDTCPLGDDALDEDFDGVADACDACPGHDDADDADLDGAPDACDAFPDDPNESVDSDGDGIGDNADPDLVVSPGDSIAAAVDAIEPGATIHLLEGVHPIDETISIRKPLEIRGAVDGSGRPVAIIDGGFKYGVMRITEIYQGLLTIRDCVLRNGQAEDGGGIKVMEAAVSIENCWIEGNNAAIGGGVCVVAGSISLRDCKIASNTCEEGEGGIHAIEAAIELLDTTICGNASGGIASVENQVTEDAILPSSSNNCVAISCEDANRDGNPDGCEASCPADIDGSGVVDAGDLGLIVAAWGTSETTGDINGDGTVDGADLAYVLGYWGVCPGP